MWAAQQEHLHATHNLLLLKLLHLIAYHLSHCAAHRCVSPRWSGSRCWGWAWILWASGCRWKWWALEEDLIWVGRGGPLKHSSFNKVWLNWASFRKNLLKTEGFYLPKYRTTDSKGFLPICFGDAGFLDISGNRTAPKMWPMTHN